MICLPCRKLSLPSGRWSCSHHKRWCFLHIPSRSEIFLPRWYHYGHWLVPGQLIPVLHHGDASAPRYTAPRYCTNKGLGPTIDISPFKIFNSSGSSSIDVERKNWPNLVSLISSGNRFPFSSFASVMVRNFKIPKIFSFFPGRSCLKNTGAPSFMRIKKLLKSAMAIRWPKPETIKWYLIFFL